MPSASWRAALGLLLAVLVLPGCALRPASEGLHAASPMVVEPAPAQAELPAESDPDPEPASGPGTSERASEGPVAPVTGGSASAAPASENPAPTPPPDDEDDDSEDEPPTLLETLLANGFLTQEQFDQLNAQAEAEQEEEAARAVLVMDKKGLAVASADGETTIEIGGRIQVEATAHSRNGVKGQDITDGTEIRRGRIEMKGKMPDGWFWVAEYDFADNDVAIKDMVMGAKFDDGTAVALGHQKQPFSLDIEMSSNDIPVVERSIDGYLLQPFVDRAIGVRVDTNGENTFFAGGIYGETAEPNKDDDEGWGGTGRFIYAPVIEDDEVVHMGVSAAYRTPSSKDKVVRIRDETTHMSNFSVVDTGQIMDVKHTTLVHGEAMVVNGPWAFIGEYHRAFIETDGPDADFDAWHIESTYSLTGESRAAAYNLGSGELKRLKPARDHTSDWESCGAWELVARVANLDLTDANYKGGDETTGMIGLNWYLNSNIRFMFDVTRILDTDNASPVTKRSEGLSFAAFRGQITF